jgi:aldose 1-epimerase
MRLSFIDLGAAVHEIFVCARDGQQVQVSALYDNPLSYEKQTTYFGAVVAPSANRIADAKFEIDGQMYAIDANDNENNLHSGYNTLAKKIWRVKEQTDSKIVFVYDAKDLEQGFPGNIHYEVSYEVTKENELVISYYAISDKKTTINMTNHTYFNLAGAFSGNVKNHKLWIKASYYTPVKDAKAIPTGEIVPVEGTPFDFRVAKTIGRDMEEEFDQLIYGKGYDQRQSVEIAHYVFNTDTYKRYLCAGI